MERTSPFGISRRTSNDRWENAEAGGEGEPELRTRATGDDFRASPAQCHCRSIGASAKNLTDRGPDGIFQFDMGRAASFGRNIGRDAVGSDDPNGNLPVSEVSVAAAVAPANRGADTADL